MICNQCHKEYDGHPESKYCSGACIRLAEIEHHWEWESLAVIRKYRKPKMFLVKQNPQAWEWARTYEGKESFYLHGNEGIGKSAMCKYMLCVAIERGKAVKAPSMRELQLLSTSFNSETLISDLGTCAYLLLDDMHDPILTDKGYSLIKLILDSRAELRRPTFITTNKNTTDMSKHIDGKCGSGFGVQLLRRLAPVRVIEMAGKSYRAAMNDDFLKHNNAHGQERD